MGASCCFNPLRSVYCAEKWHSLRLQPLIYEHVYNRNEFERFGEMSRRAIAKRKKNTKFVCRPRAAVLIKLVAFKERLTMRH